MATDEMLFQEADVAAQIRRQMDEVDGRLMAAALDLGKIAATGNRQTKRSNKWLGKCDHGYDHPYGDGSCLVIHDHKMAGAGRIFQLKLRRYA